MRFRRAAVWAGGLGLVLFALCWGRVDARLAAAGSAATAVSALGANLFLIASRQRREHLRLLSRARSGHPPREGRATAVFGTLHPVGEPIRAPFTGVECLAYGYRVCARDLVPNISDDGPAETETEVTKAFGRAQAAVEVHTAAGPVRLLGTPDLGSFPERFVSGAAEMERAKEYLRSQFTRLYAPSAQIDALSSGEAAPGTVRRDWLSPSLGIQDITELYERRIPPGSEVCAVGVYSTEGPALVEGGPAGLEMSLYPGDPARVAADVDRMGRSSRRVGLGCFLVACLAIWGVVAFLQQGVAAGDAVARREELITAVRTGQAERVRVLLAAGAEPDLLDEARRPLLLLATELDTVRLLIENGAPLDGADSRGRTALMTAAVRGRTELVRLLIESGADVTLTDDEGHTALDLARRLAPPETVQLLNRAGAPEGTRPP